jgi:hypothetical protein
MQVFRLKTWNTADRGFFSGKTARVQEFKRRRFFERGAGERILDFGCSLRPSVGVNVRPHRSGFVVGKTTKAPRFHILYRGDAPFPECWERGEGGIGDFDCACVLASARGERILDWRAWESLLEWGELHVLSTNTPFVALFGTFPEGGIVVSRI